MTPEERIKARGWVLPELPVPLASYVAFRQTGNLLYLSGQGPRMSDGRPQVGCVGVDVSVEDAYQHARQTGLYLLSAAKAAVGELSRVTAVVKLLGMVNSAPTFREHPKVINGCSDLFVDVFGEAGRHARSAVGVSSLPFGISVEIEVILELGGSIHQASG
jgi:enamine deaminase RidA (YjgF/YER057c/UK114 family)